ncbi:MAG: GDP-mannose 4,6-dehydratase [Acidimicrobiia bacterium]|nr:GDP-mannose 4,6-dehydratase [Acidimicrobiia bacterium]
MRALVTGAAGFVGSHLAERLVVDGWDVIGIDNFSDYYPSSHKRHNLAESMGNSEFGFIEADLYTVDLDSIMKRVDVVFHQAGQPGVRSSWDAFDTYVLANVSVTNRMLLAARDCGIEKFVYASSSSIYGDASRYPTSEDVRPQPMSPYGVTKLAAEHLCGVFARNYDVPTVSLRYFTVYGPRQRPDMGMYRSIEAALGAGRFPLYGDGRQVRDFTFVGDVVDANIRAATQTTTPGLVANIAGGAEVSLAEVIQTIERIVGRPVPIDAQDSQPGDVARTGADTTRATDVLQWSPSVSLVDGLQQQVQWHLQRRAVEPASLTSD